jgi:tetratricopeptide (TPR) repeat protein
MTSRCLTLSLLVLGGAILLRADDTPVDQLTPYETALTDYKTGKNDAALAAIDEAEKAKPGDPTTEILKARILGELLRFGDAIKTLTDLNGSAEMTPDFKNEQTLALGDIDLHKRDFPAAAKFYDSLLTPVKPDPDLLLKAIYARIGMSDLLTAGKYFSELKPLDTVNPSYYYAKAALARANGQSSQADDALQTAQTLYGITVTNRYLKVYLRFFIPDTKNSESTSTVKPAPSGAR